MGFTNRLWSIGLLISFGGVQTVAFAQASSVSQVTSSQFVPTEKRFVPTATQLPNVVSQQMLHAWADKTWDIKRFVDPTKGVWVITYVTGEADEPPSAIHRCGTDLDKTLKSLRIELRDKLKLADFIGCHNNRATPVCSVSEQWEFGTSLDWIFQRNANGEVILQAMLTRNSTYRDEKNEARYVNKVLQRAEQEPCPSPASEPPADRSPSG